MPHHAYLSLGSNVGDRAANLREALHRLARFGQVVAVSSVYETAPVEVLDQPWFLNCVAALDTDRTAADLVSEALGIERALGRTRDRSKGPRTIDIDVLLFGDQIVSSATLTIPHPAMHVRRFVLEPLAEIAPDVRHPVLHKTARELLQELPAGQDVRKTTAKLV